MLAPSWQILYPKVLELSLRLVGFSMSLCPMPNLELFLSGSLTASDQGSPMTIGELLNISTLDPCQGLSTLDTIGAEAAAG